MTKQSLNNEKLIDSGLNDSDMFSLARKLEEHLCQNIELYKISPIFSYADYVILATTVSDIQRKGIIQMLPDLLHELSLGMYSKYFMNRSQLANSGGWILLDFRDFIIHLMTGELRDFYEMDKLFFETKKLSINHS